MTKSWKGIIKGVIIAAAGLLPVGFLVYPLAFSSLSCVEETRYQPLPYYGDLYQFPKYNVPETARPGSVNITTIITVPEYKTTDSQEYVSGPRLTAYGQMTKEMDQIFRSFAGSLGDDMEAQMVAKGMTTKGPFLSDEITYTDKKASDLMATVNIILDIRNAVDANTCRTNAYQSLGYVTDCTGTLSVGIKVYYQLLEPLSGEKMWIKKLDLGVYDGYYQYGLYREQYVAGYGGCGEPIYSYRATEKKAFDGSHKVFSEALKQAYPQIMKTSWTYFDTNEMLVLKEKSYEVRDRKRY